MGGFFAGLGAAAGGAGDAALHYGEEQRRDMLQQWGVRQAALAELIGHARDTATTPERQTELSALQAKVLKAKPGEDPSKILMDVQNHLSLHPVAHEALSPPEPPKPQAGPAQPGEVPGRGTLGGMISGPFGSAGLNGAAAQPASSPVQQGGPIQLGGGAPSVSQGAAPPVSPQRIGPVGEGPEMQAFHGAMTAGSMPHPVAAAAQPFLLNQAQLEHTKQMDDYLLHNLGPQRLDYIKASVPNWDSLPPFIKASYAAASAGIQVPGMMGMASAMYGEPHKLQVDVTGMPAAARAEYGIPPDAAGKWTVDIDRMSKQPIRAYQGWAGVTTATDTAGNQTRVGNNQQMGADAIHSVAPTQSTPHLITLPNGGTGFESAAQARAGVSPTPTGGIAPAMQPRTTESTRTVQTTDADGNPVTRFEPVTSRTTRGGIAPVGGAGAGPTAKEFERPFTPEQQLKHEQQTGQYNMAIDRVKAIKSQLPLLNSMLEAGKLNLEMDSGGLIRALVNRQIPLTPAEASFIGNFRTMMEDINLLRGPMGATGFRGPEAWAALQAQRGQLLANPAITKQVLENTLTALQAQQAPLAKRGFSKTPPVAGGSGSTVEDLVKKYGGH